MSDPQPLPPLPPQDSQAIPPVQPPVLSYAPAGPGRPGILTALGVVSVVVGGLTTLTNSCGVFQSITFVVMALMTSAIITSPTTGPGNPFAGLPAAPLILNAVLGLASFALAIYLIVCGAIVLRDGAGGRKHHFRYAILKFVVAIPAALAEGWSTYSMQSAIMAKMPPPTTMAAGPGASAWFSGVGSMSIIIAVAMAGFWFVASLIYPTAVLIVMNLKQVKAYYVHLATPPRY